MLLLLNYSYILSNLVELVLIEFKISEHRGVEHRELSFEY